MFKRYIYIFYLCENSKNTLQIKSDFESKRKAEIIAFMYFTFIAARIQTCSGSRENIYWVTWIKGGWKHLLQSVNNRTTLRVKIPMWIPCMYIFKIGTTFVCQLHVLMYREIYYCIVLYWSLYVHHNKSCIIDVYVRITSTFYQYQCLFSEKRAIDLKTRQTHINDSYKLFSNCYNQHNSNSKEGE